MTTFRVNNGIGVDCDIDAVLNHLGDNAVTIHSHDLVEGWTGLATNIVNDNEEIDGCLIHFPGVTLEEVTYDDAFDLDGNEDFHDPETWNSLDPEDSPDDYDEAAYAQDAIDSIMDVLHAFAEKGEVSDSALKSAVDVIRSFDYIAED